MGRLHLGLGALVDIRVDERLEVDDDTLHASPARSWLLILAREIDYTLGLEVFDVGVPQDARHGHVHLQLIVAQPSQQQQRALVVVLPMQPVQLGQSSIAHVAVGAKPG